MKKILIHALSVFALITSMQVNAEQYKIDTDGGHAFIQFKIKHLGYSWLHGKFNKFEGSFDLDRNNLENSSIKLTIDPASIDTNHKERDKYLRDESFLAVKSYPTATFTSTDLKLKNDNSGILTGNLSLHGVTKAIEIPVKLFGEGNDPWGGYRVGFEGNTILMLKDFGLENFALADTQVEMTLSIEGIQI